MKKNEIDWMGAWYDIIRERNENDCPTLGRVDLTTNEVDWVKFSHAQMDGVGALINYYKKTDFKDLVYPTLREKNLPTFSERISIFYRLIFSKKNSKPKWLETNENEAPLNPLEISYTIFSQEETKKLLDFCKQNNFSSNAFLMNLTNRYFLSTLSNSFDGTWTLPVNLRPVLKKENQEANHSSGVLVNIAFNESPRDTHQKIANSLKLKEHWGIWWIHQIGKYIGKRGMKYLSEKNAKKNFVMGSFSNLSSWGLPTNHIWVGSPPGSKNFPISIMVMQANAHISLSLKIHPYIMKNQQKTPEHLHALKAEILRVIA